ncbi:hypothetical protein [Salinimicrobium soli]|uniref:hypothetical protein n=1 Tax=Salinimicrobium soli TaxID=1254399 RepID=UPI003AAAB39F
MKKYITKIALLAFVSILGVSCDWDETEYQSLLNDYDPNSTYYIQFNDAAQGFETSFDANGQPVNVETSVAVKLVGPPQSEDITVNLTLDPSSDITESMFEIGTKSLVIPAGQTSASTDLTIFTDMLPVDETSSLVMTIDAGANTATAGDVLTYNVFRTPPCIPIPGEYRIVMTDSYGDGWQTTNGDAGEGITVEVDGVKIAEIGLCSPYAASAFTCTDDSSEGETTVTIPEGSLFAKWVFPGDWWGEIGYEIYDPNGVLVASAKAGEGEAGTIDVQACVQEEAAE